MQGVWGIKKLWIFVKGCMDYETSFDVYQKANRKQVICGFFSKGM